MKNKMIKSPEELQKHVDYIIEYSDIISLCENRTKKEEEIHLNVDAILAEPLTDLKKYKHQKVTHVRPMHTRVRHDSLHAHIPSMPKRERLIVHGEIYETKRQTRPNNIFTSIFKTNRVAL